MMPGMLAETIGRFRREATVIGGLRHQNIVGALDAGRMANQLFMVMELAPGISLASMMDERGARGMGLFPVTSVLRIAEQVCAGLAAAHAAGVVHRDIKPSNLMVTPQLGVKIIDFGIARLLADNSPRLTLPAQTVGTIAYMSPEQAQGLDVDGRADLYSLGCVLYQLLSGRPPFFSTLPGALLMMQVMDRPAPLDVVRPDLPAGLSELVSDLMEKEPGGPARDRGRGRSAGSRRSRASSGSRSPSSRPTARRSGPPTTSARWVTPGLTRAGRSRSGPPSSPRSGATALPGRAGQAGRARGFGSPWARQSSRALPPVQFPVPAQPGPPLPSAPQAATGMANSVPNWPEVRRRRRARARSGAACVSTLITAAIVAGVGAYLWERDHQALKITTVNGHGREASRWDATARRTSSARSPPTATAGPSGTSGSAARRQTSRSWSTTPAAATRCRST